MAYLTTMKTDIAQQSITQIRQMNGHGHIADVAENIGYIRNIDDIRANEYPMLKDTTYLDHAGATPPAKSLVDIYANDLTSNLFGNPHSMSASSLLSTTRIDNVRLQLLKFFDADPDEFDLVFTANATAAIKLVAETFRDLSSGFRYVYHRDSHTSLVGVRELAQHGSHCVDDDEEAERLLSAATLDCRTNGTCETYLFAYPAQSNMTGHRRTQTWCRAARQNTGRISRTVYTLYDAASLVSTEPLVLNDISTAPDFTVLSFYKIFGFPDLGALIIRKRSSDVFTNRRYFAGGTVDLVTVEEQQPWHAKRSNLHNTLEDGTLPFHHIVALQHALSVHQRLYGSMLNISRHVSYLTKNMHQRLHRLEHANGQRVCKSHSVDPSTTTTTSTSGPIISFNLLDKHGQWISNSEVEKLCVVKNIQFRTGGVCNPGGISKHLELSSDDLRRNYAAGQRCGGSNDIINGKATGVIRISFGAMSSIKDVDTFIDFLEEFYVDRDEQQKPQQQYQQLPPPLLLHRNDALSATHSLNFVIESLTVFPIKSCAGFKVPENIDWEILPKGLAYDREWCLVHQGTNTTLSQKQFPQMALLQPSIDLEKRSLTVRSLPQGRNSSLMTATSAAAANEITIHLDEYPDTEGVMNNNACRFKNQQSIVCGEKVLIHLCMNPEISDFFTTAIGVPCTLARYPQRQETHQQRYANIRRIPSSPSPSPSQSADSNSDTDTDSQNEKNVSRPSIKLANESPILLVSRSSVDRLNEQIGEAAALKSNGTSSSSSRGVTTDSFRGNIVIAQKVSPFSMSSSSPSPSKLRNDANDTITIAPYIEETFTSLTIRDTVHFNVLGPCQRCQMVCINQMSGKRSSEPFSTLAKTRKKAGRVWFGMHLCLDLKVHCHSDDAGNEERKVVVRVGDKVEPSFLPTEGKP